LNTDYGKTQKSVQLGSEWVFRLSQNMQQCQVNGDQDKLIVVNKKILQIFIPKPFSTYQSFQRVFLVKHLLHYPKINKMVLIMSTTSTSTFDTHEFFNELKSAGFSEQQAEVITRLQKTTITTTLEQARHDYQLDDLATKRDLKEIELTLKRDLKELELRLESRIKDTELKIVESKADLIRWVVGVGVLQTALITALLIKLSAAI
jgi:hypothetical protein